MDVFKAQFEKIKAQLAALSASQRMLVAALVAVMVMTLLYWGKYAGEAEMTPLFTQAVSEDQIGKIDIALTGDGVAHSVSGDRILVPADKKQEVLANLMYRQLLPRDSRSAFDELDKNSNMFVGPEESGQRYVRA